MQSLVAMVMMMFYQASGRPSGNHGLYHRYRIEALTMRGRGENWEYGHGFLETGKYVHIINNYYYCFIIHSRLSKVAGCWRKSPPTWLVLAGYSAWRFFTDGVFYIKYPWTGRLL